MTDDRRATPRRQARRRPDLDVLGYELAFGGGALIMSDSEGHVAGYRIAA